MKKVAPMTKLVLLLLPMALCGQPSIRTELRNGVVRAAVLHAASGQAVTDDAPALPGETLLVQGAGFVNGVQVLLGGAAALTTVLDEATAQFTLPPDAGGSFLEILAASAEGVSNAATLPVDAASDAVQLGAAEVQTLVEKAALAADGARMAIAVVDRAGRVLAVFRRP